MATSTLTELLGKRSFWVYTDGSAATQGQRTGSYAAHILYGSDNSKIELVCGTASQTTINRMELLSIIESIRRITELCDGIVHGSRFVYRKWRG